MGGRSLDDHELLRQAREGDLDAFATLLRRHEDAARRLARFLCGSEGDDATQDAFVKSWTALRRFRGDAPYRSWLLAIVANESRNRVRSSGRRLRHELRRAEDRVSGEAAPSPEAAVLELELRRTLMRAVDALPDHLRDVVVCRHLLDLTEAETAHVIGAPKGTVKSRLARALDRLRAELAEPIAGVRDSDV